MFSHSFITVHTLDHTIHHNVPAAAASNVAKYGIAASVAHHVGIAQIAATAKAIDVRITIQFFLIHHHIISHAFVCLYTFCLFSTNDARLSSCQPGLIKSNIVHTELYNQSMYNSISFDIEFDDLFFISFSIFFRFSRSFFSERTLSPISFILIAALRILSTSFSLNGLSTVCF
ncbi:hypothetical protein II582_00315 [bacterium]|nr:hypothetical protein [bacterium]